MCKKKSAKMLPQKSPILHLIWECIFINRKFYFQTTEMNFDTAEISNIYVYVEKKWFESNV